MTLAEFKAAIEASDKPMLCTVNPGFGIIDKPQPTFPWPYQSSIPYLQRQLAIWEKAQIFDCSSEYIRAKDLTLEQALWQHEFNYLWGSAIQAEPFPYHLCQMTPPDNGMDLVNGVIVGAGVVLFFSLVFSSVISSLLFVAALIIASVVGSICWFIRQIEGGAFWPSKRERQERKQFRLWLSHAQHGPDPRRDRAPAR